MLNTTTGRAQGTCGGTMMVSAHVSYLPDHDVPLGDAVGFH